MSTHPTPRTGGLKPVAKITGQSGASSRISSNSPDWASTRWAGRLRHFLLGRLAGASRGGPVLTACRCSNRPTAILESRRGCPPAAAHERPHACRAERCRDRPKPRGRAGRRPGDAAGGSASPAVGPMWPCRRRGRPPRAGRRHRCSCGGMGAVSDLVASSSSTNNDEALQEGSPTWHAAGDIERARRAAHVGSLVSPSTLTALEWGSLHRPIERERAGWPLVDVVDRTDEEPWKRSLLTFRSDPTARRP